MAMSEEWEILQTFFPKNWVEMASSSGALKGLRKNKDAENYLRTLLLHIGCGYSMRETSARAKLSGLADISDVAFLGRLRKSKDWLRNMCIALFEEKQITTNINGDFSFRLFDATLVNEPGKTGSSWRIHYSVEIPSLKCDFFKVSATKGQGTGESFFQYPIRANDYIIADRGYSRAPGIHHVISKNAFVIVRVNTGALPILNGEGEPFPLLQSVKKIKKPGLVKFWDVHIPNRNNSTVSGRVCAIRKSNEAIKIAHAKIIRQAQKRGNKVKPETFEYAKYIIVFSNYPEKHFSADKVLELYRARWQIELVFKRFKSIAQLGHLPKHSDDSSLAWLYGKLFVALLTEKIIECANVISPWGYTVEERTKSMRMA